MNRKYRTLILVLVLAASLLAAWRIGSARLREETVHASDDALSTGLDRRWGGGLPPGYTAEVADDLDAAGHLFARLTYEKDIGGLLEKWTAPTDVQLADYEAMLEAHAAAEIPQAHRTLLENAAALPAGELLAYTAAREGAQLVLLYDPQSRVLYWAEWKE